MLNYIKFEMFLENNFAWEIAWWSTWVEEVRHSEKKESNDSLSELRKKFEAIKAWEKYVSWREEKLRTSLLKDWDPKDKEFRELAEEVKRLQWESKALWQTRDELWALLWEIQTEIKKLSPEETKALKTLENKDFLSIPFEKRLQYITANHTDTADVSSWKVKNLEFSFTFDWEFNRELYFKTTAWQVLPQEVWEVSLWGKVFSRAWLEWEFFSWNERLVIKEWTSIEIWKLRTQDEMEKAMTQNLNKTESFLANNPWVNREIVLEAYNRWIDPDFAVKTFSHLIEWVAKENIPQVLEDAFTEFDRYRWSYNISNELVDWKYSDRLALGLFMKFTPNWEESAESYWISKQSIETAKSNWEVNMAMEANAIQNADSLPDWSYLKWDKLLENPEFSAKIDKICSNIWANREDLIRVMKVESWLDPRIVNSQTRATWLIQFMPKTAEGLWTTVWKLRAMTALEQLDFVELYFKKNAWGHSLNTIEKLYQVVFYPLSLSKWPEFVFWSQNWTAELVASQNPWISKFSSRADKLIDWHCFSRYVNNHVSRYTV